jgi:hypothetical protein
VERPTVSVCEKKPLRDEGVAEGFGFAGADRQGEDAAAAMGGVTELQVPDVGL